MAEFNTNEYVKSVKLASKLKNNFLALLPILSLLVILGVFWWLKLTGITMAGDAFCGHKEHTHNSECYKQVLICKAETDGDNDLQVSESQLTATESVQSNASFEAVNTETEVNENNSETVESINSTNESTSSTNSEFEINSASQTDVSSEKTNSDTSDSLFNRSAESENSEVSETSSAESTVTKKHVHTDECYEKVFACDLNEHIHKAECYSNVNADLETAEVWEKTMSKIPLGLSKSEMVVEIAKSQLDYSESHINFVIDDLGVRRGYTRFGEWYGNPYGEWSSMFTSFCLRYAEYEDLPINSGADAMLNKWTEMDIFQPVNKYVPEPGDIVFLDKDLNNKVETTAVVIDATDKSVTVIEGDLDNKVAKTTYSVKDGYVYGYGVSAPQNKVMNMVIKSTSKALKSIAKTTNYNANQLNDNNSFVVYTESAGKYYAFDGNGNAVEIFIDDNGNITADVTNPDILLWTFNRSSNNVYTIKNNNTGRYMHAFPDNGSSVTTGGEYTSTVVTQNNGTIKIRSNNEYARLDTGSGTFQMTQNQSLAAAYRLGVVSNCTVWLDGTNGGLMALGGSANRSYKVEQGGTIKLPTEWQSPEKYQYKLNGWYDVKNSKYYPPGAEVAVNENLVFYADWVAATYDIGKFNTHTADTISTNNFITTKVFDYNDLFNVLSQSVNVNVSASSHSETWSQVRNGNVPYNNSPTIDYSFIDYDPSGDISYSNNRGSNNQSGGIYAGLYNDKLGDILFNTENTFNHETGEGIIGKHYIGTGDHLFQIMDDPTNQHYGYYYYDSRLNAASYNQSDGRFYVYDYLVRTSDSGNAGGETGNSDFLPLNSPYENIGNKTVNTYSYNGDNGEYAGVTHYQYDARYNTDGSSVNNVATNLWFGMSMNIDFYLPDTPGSQNAEGQYGNKDIYGKDMHFKFSGDDDVWVFIDGELVLDLGGIHPAVSGDINFSTGVVTVDGRTTNLNGIGEGEHVLTIYYLERGSSQSNCAIYFNLAPRFALELRKEDVLSQEELHGAEFSVYTDASCTNPAVLWKTEEDYHNDVPATNTFKVEDGLANIWGFGAGKTYYIKETKPPDNQDYGLSKGIIALSFDKKGASSYSINVINEKDQNGKDIPITNGFTVHGFQIDEETQSAYVVITNAEEWVKELTTVQVAKKWNDTLDHTYDSITVYLTVTDADGTVRRIREIELSPENNWSYTWTNLPKYYENGVTLVDYGVEEAYKSGYSPTIEKVDRIVIENTFWAESYEFKNGETYVLKCSNGFLSAKGTDSDTFKYVDEATAKSSPLALWKATVSSGKVKLANSYGQTITINSGWYSRYFSVTNDNNPQNQGFTSTNTGNAIVLGIKSGNTTYYIGNVDSSGRPAVVNNTSSATKFTPMTLVTESIIEEVEDVAYTITNTPLEEETSLKVTKDWDLGNSTHVSYEQSQVTVKLFANGVDTGRTVTLNLKNNWTETFQGLPYEDNDGNVISYTVAESWDTKDWLPSYGEVITVSGDPPQYKVTVTNIYRWGRGYELPSTGGRGRKIWIIILMIYVLFKPIKKIDAGDDFE